MNLQQNHFGSGDNISGNKIIYNNENNSTKKLTEVEWVMVIVAILTFLWGVYIYYKPNTANTVDINQTHYGSGDNVAGDKIVNKQAIYTWINKNSLNPVQNSPEQFRTELIFQADSGILPSQVCLDIQADVEVITIDRGINPMMGSLMNGIHCFQSPSRYETIGIITRSKPKITNARLMSN